MKRAPLLLFLAITCCSLRAQVSVSIVDYRAAICPGYVNSFTAVAKNGGLNTVYQWQVNGANAGTNSNVFSSGTLKDQDKVTCTVHDLVIPYAPVTSDVITMVAGSTEKPGLALAQTQASNCGVQFQALPINGGSAPVYQWWVNGVSAGGNSPILNYGRPGGSDVVTCAVTNTTTCALENTVSHSITVSGAAPGIQVTITASPGPYICDGDWLWFSVSTTPANAGHFFQFYVNGVQSVGLFNAGQSFGQGGMKNGDLVTCELLHPTLAWHQARCQPRRL